MNLTRNNLHIVQNFLSGAAQGPLPDVNVDSVTPVPDKPVAYNTAFGAVGLPATVTVQLDNATEQSMSVTWVQGAYVATTPGPVSVFGFLTLPGGILNPAGVVATVRVIVSQKVLNITDVEDLPDLNVEENTPFSETGLPSEVLVTLSNATTRLLPVTWTQGTYNPMTPGTYNIQGTLTIADPNITNTGNLQPIINIVVTAMAPVQRVIVSAAAQGAITTPYGTAFGSLPLPAQVNATLDDATVVAIDVSWQVGSYSATTPATYNISGNFVNLPANVVNTSNIHPTKSVQVLVQAGGEDGVQVKKLLGTAGATLGYLQYLPTDYSANPSKLYPTIIFLHGAGQRGLGNSSTELDKILTTDCPPKHIANGSTMTFTNPLTGLPEKFIVISPQTNAWIWHNQGMVFTQWLINSGLLRIDPNRVYMTGLSMGGMGTWENPATNANTPNLIAAIGAACPGATPAVGRGTNVFNKHIKAWAFHCLDDTTAVPFTTQRPVNEIKALTSVVDSVAMDAAVGNPDYIVSYYATGGHYGAWNNAYKTGHTVHNPNLYEWFLTKTKS